MGEAAGVWGCWSGQDEPPAGDGATSPAGKLEPGASPGLAVNTPASSQRRSYEVFPHFTDEETEAH